MSDSHSCLPLYFYRLVLCWGFWISPFLFLCFSALLISFKLILDWQKFCKKNKKQKTQHREFTYIFSSLSLNVNISYFQLTYRDYLNFNHFSLNILLLFWSRGSHTAFRYYASLVSFNWWQLLVLPSLMTVALLVITSQLFHRMSHFEFASFYLMIGLKLCICIKKGHRSNFLISPRGPCYCISGDVNLG